MKILISHIIIKSYKNQINTFLRLSISIREQLNPERVGCMHQNGGRSNMYASSRSENLSNQKILKKKYNDTLI